MFRYLLLLLVAHLALASSCWGQSKYERVLQIDVTAPIDRGAHLLLKRGFEAAQSQEADLIVLRLNTYGGAVDMADSMRTMLLNSPIPVWAFVDNQAISAGALIALACDSIFMRPGASMGAATVVDGTGAAQPDKYQSFMRATMRSTAEAKGTLGYDSAGAPIYRRDPRIAEAMVDATLEVAGVSDSGRVLTLTAQEAERLGYCDGQAESIRQILAERGINPQSVIRFEPSVADRFKGFLMSPVVVGLMIMMILGGLYFELQTPGVGFPLIVAIVGAVGFFLPHFLDGLVQHLDIILFIIGIILLLIEIFAIPGFGVTGIAGIICIVGGLALSMVDNTLLFSWTPDSLSALIRAVAVVVVALTLSLIGSIVLGGVLISSPRLPALALHRNLGVEDGYVATQLDTEELVGQHGESVTVLRPSGKVRIGGTDYDALSTRGIVEAGVRVEVVKVEATQVYVRPVLEG